MVKVRIGPATSIFLALVAGIACGLFFGDYCSHLAVVGEVFVGLLRMTALPYIIVTLIANLGRLSHRHSRQLAVVGSLVLMGMWVAAVCTILLMVAAYPESKTGSFFSTALVTSQEETNLVEVFVPSNVFRALAENHVPAVVLMSIFAGLSLASVPNHPQLILLLDVAAEVCVRVSRFIVRLAPIGVFAIAASTSGTLEFIEFQKLQAYLVTYCAGALLLGFVVLPGLVASCTELRYREILAASKDAMIMAFATGKLLLVIPLLIQQTEMLSRKLRAKKDTDAVPTVDVVCPVAYAFPHVGKLLGMLFIPFTAWFLGKPLGPSDYPPFLLEGVFAYFGGPVVAMPFLLDQMHLPQDMFHLFLLSGVIGERVGDALGAMHLVAFTMLTTAAILGQLTFRLDRLLKYLAGVAGLSILLLLATRTTLAQAVRSLEDRQQVLSNLHLLDVPGVAVILRESEPNPEPRLPGESTLDRIRRRGAMRVGYNEDKLPFAFRGAGDGLVGFDVNMAYRLANDLGVRIEFVQFERETLDTQLDEDHFDIVMSGLLGTLDRSLALHHTEPYMDVTLALIVPDYRARNFNSVAKLRRMEKLQIGVADLSGGFVPRFRELLPNAELVELRTNREFFESTQHDLDALLISAESGSAFTLLHPDFQVVVPSGVSVTLPLFYALGTRDEEFLDFLNHWLALRKRDGTTKEYYEHWILGKSTNSNDRRWCVIRDVLHWVD